MKLAAFFSGGKDSCYAIYKAKKLGHTIEALITIIPYSNESNLLHYDNITKTKVQSESMNISHIIDKSVSTNTTDEISLLHKLISEAKNNFQIDGIVHGGILSEFQKSKFESICDDLKLKLGKVTGVITGNVTFNILRKNSKIEKGLCYRTFELKDGDQLDIISTNKSVYGYFQ